MSRARLNLRSAGLNDAGPIARVHVTTWRAAYAGLVPDTYLVGMTEVGQMRLWRRLLGRPQACKHDCFAYSRKASSIASAANP